MWTDNASEIDMLYVKPYADLICNILNDKEITPVTIGIYGPWGAGKSSLLNFICQKNKENHKIETIFINAWMLEGYADAKSAIIESIVLALKNNQKFTEKIKDKVESILKKVNWWKLTKSALKTGLAAGTSLATANPIPIIMSIASDSIKTLKDNPQELVNSITNIQRDCFKSGINDDELKNVRDLNKEFKELIELTELDNLIIIIDDLDRCLPERIIDTLEAIKLFLSVPKVSYILAIDEDIIKYAVKQKYPMSKTNGYDIGDEYIEKIIQIPITLPYLSKKDIRNYFKILVITNILGIELSEQFLNFLSKEEIWIKAEITKEVYLKFCGENSVGNEVVSKLDTEFDVLIGIIGVVDSCMRGNPRQVKRFLNAYYLKNELLKLYYGNNCDSKILAKILALNFINHNCFLNLAEWSSHYRGCIENLEKFENKDEISEENLKHWNNDLIKQWLDVEPKNLSKYDLNDYFYLTRDLLKEKKNIESDLNEFEREFLKNIRIFEGETLKKHIEKLTEIDENERNKIVHIIIEEYKNDKIEMQVLAYPFIIFSEYRDNIIEILKTKYQNDIPIKDVPILANMYKEEKVKIKQMIIDLNLKNMNSILKRVMGRDYGNE